MPGPEAPSRIELEWDLQQGARLLRHPFSRFAWRRRRTQATLFCSGVDHVMPVKDARLLAAAESIDGEAYASLFAKDVLPAITEILEEAKAKEATAAKVTA